jgi:osmotically-inducible protein OsmY
VTIDGRVTTEAERARIDSEVRNTPGVVGVKDELKVELPAAGGPGPYSPAAPIYQIAPPEVTPPTTVVTMPPPVVIAQYPRLKLQAWTMEDQDAANRIGHQLQVAQVPTAWLQDVNITVRNGNAWVRGLVDSQEQHDMVIASIQHAGGVRAIYDQLQIRR